MKIKSSLFSIIILLAAVISFYACSSLSKDHMKEEKSGSPIPGADAIAIFGYRITDSRFFTQHITDDLGDELAWGKWDGNNTWNAMTSFSVGGEQFIMGHGQESSGNGYKWFIQRLDISGELGTETDSNGDSRYWHDKYDQLVGFEVGDRTFILGQKDNGNDSNRWFVQEILPGGTLAQDESLSGHWEYFYSAVTPVYLDNRTALLLHTKSGKNYWKIIFIDADSDGKVTYEESQSGTWSSYWPLLSSYRAGKHSYIFGHRKKLVWDWKHIAKYHGPWFIQRVHDNGRVGDTVQQKEFDNYYATIDIFYWPSGDKFYLIGQNTDKHFFIQHLTYSGEMGEQTYTKNFEHYWDHLFPFHIDSDYYHLDNWMARHKNIIGDRKLNEIAIPGSHDAGMSEHHDCFGGNKCNTVTQFEDIYDQLKLGSRYFDIRPMILSPGGTDWDTGHATHSASSNLGCRGESKLDITNGLHKFFNEKKHSKELVILKVSHCMGKPGIVESGTCSSSQIQNLANNLSGHLDDHIITCQDCDLKAMTLNQLLEKGNILLLFTGINSNKKKGIFRVGEDQKYDYYLYDDYANKDSFWAMRNDQIDKLLNEKNHLHDRKFLLSWTLTLSEKDALKCLIQPYPSILDLTYYSNYRLLGQLDELVDKKKITKSLFPNILYVDGFSGSATRTAIYLNEKYAGLPD